MEVAPLKDGVADVAALSSMLNDETACVYVQSPNYYGLIEDVAAISEACHAAGVKVIMGCNPIALALFQNTGGVGRGHRRGRRAAVGHAACVRRAVPRLHGVQEDMTRKMPERIAGQTTDAARQPLLRADLAGARAAYHLEKALSSVCSNQALCALTATVYIAAMGETGIAEAASSAMRKRIIWRLSWQT